MKRGGNKGEVTKLLLEVVVLGLMTFTPPLEEARFVIRIIKVPLLQELGHLPHMALPAPLPRDQVAVAHVGTTYGDKL